jgi:hypothetical protein
MLIRNIEQDYCGALRLSVAMVEWEENEFPPQPVVFEIEDAARDPSDEANHFLAALFPLALLHRERRIAIDASVCPMLTEGVMLVHAWWTQWGGLPSSAPVIESTRRRHALSHRDAPKRGVSFLSGGVDSLHLLLHNRRSFRPGDPGYIRDAVFVHGFDIGKRRRAPENERAARAFEALSPLAGDMGVRLVHGFTDFRHLPSAADFWNLRHSGAAMAGFGHFAASGPAFVYMAGPTDITGLSPFGLHPAVDPNYSSQRVTIIHDGARFSRLDKVRDLLQWPAALGALRVCPANVGELLNCGECTKCLQTRLELLAAGCDECAAFGETRIPPELLEQNVTLAFPYQATHFRDVLSPLWERGLDALCRVIERKLAQYEDSSTAAPDWDSAKPRISIRDAEAPQFLKHRCDLAAVGRVT